MEGSHTRRIPLTPEEAMGRKDLEGYNLFYLDIPPNVETNRMGGNSYEMVFADLTRRQASELSEKLYTRIELRTPTAK